jgi:hypothetical protein
MGLPHRVGKVTLREIIIYDYDGGLIEAGCGDPAFFYHIVQESCFTPLTPSHTI